MLVEGEAETLGDTVVDVKATTLVETVAETKAEAEAETLGESLGDVKAEAWVATLAESLKRRRLRRLHTLCNWWRPRN